MKIFSYRYADIFSKAASDRIIAAIRRASGPIILPITLENLKNCRKMAKNADAIALLVDSPFGLDMVSMGSIALSLGKDVIPLFDRSWAHLEKKFDSDFRAFKVNTVNANDSSRLHTIFSDKKYSIEASRRMVCSFEKKSTRHHFSRVEVGCRTRKIFSYESKSGECSNVEHGSRPWKVSASPRVVL